MDFLKTIGGKIATGLVALAVIAGGVSWFQTDPQTRQGILSAGERLTGWVVAVLALPWLGFWMIGWVNRLESNLAGAALVLLLSAAEAVALAWLFGFSMHSHSAVALYGSAVLVAGVYNLFACDWIAEQTE